MSHYKKDKSKKEDNTNRKKPTVRKDSNDGKEDRKTPRPGNRIKK